MLCSAAMPKKAEDNEKGGAWIFRDIPREFMRRVKAVAAREGTTIKALVLEALEKKTQELEKKHTQQKSK